MFREYEKRHQELLEEIGDENLSSDGVTRAERLVSETLSKIKSLFQKLEQERSTQEEGRLNKSIRDLLITLKTRLGDLKTEISRERLSIQQQRETGNATQPEKNVPAPVTVLPHPVEKIKGTRAGVWPEQTRLFIKEQLDAFINAIEKINTQLGNLPDTCIPTERIHWNRSLGTAINFLEQTKDDIDYAKFWRAVKIFSRVYGDIAKAFEPLYAKEFNKITTKIKLSPLKESLLRIIVNYILSFTGDLRDLTTPGGIDLSWIEEYVNNKISKITKVIPLRKIKELLVNLAPLTFDFCFFLRQWGCREVEKSADHNELLGSARPFQEERQKSIIITGTIDLIFKLTQVTQWPVSIGEILSGLSVAEVLTKEELTGILNLIISRLDDFEIKGKNVCRKTNGSSPLGESTKLSEGRKHRFPTVLQKDRRGIDTTTSVKDGPVIYASYPHSSSPVERLMQIRAPVFFGEPFANPVADKGEIPQPFMGGDCFEGFNLWGLQTQRDKFLFGPAKFHLNGFKLIQKISDTMGIPKPALFFQGPKFGDMPFHNSLPPSIKPSFGFRHRSGSNNFGSVLPKIFKDYGQISTASSLSQGNVSIESRLENKRFGSEEDFFYFFGLNVVSGNMQNGIIVPGNNLYFQSHTSILSIIRNTKDVKKNLVDSSSPVSIFDSLQFTVYSLQHQDDMFYTVHSPLLTGGVSRSSSPVERANLSIGSEVKRVIKALKEKDALIRRYAAYLLGLRCDSRAVPALLKVLKKDEDVYARIYSAKALGKIGNLRAVSSLLEVWKKDKACYVKQAVADALFKIYIFNFHLLVIKDALSATDPSVKLSAEIAILGWFIQRERLRNREAFYQQTNSFTLQPLLKLFRGLRIEDLKLGTQQYIKILIFSWHYEGKTIKEIDSLIKEKIKELREEEVRYNHLPNTGCEIGFPMKLDKEQKQLLAREAQLRGTKSKNKIKEEESELSGKAEFLRIIFNSFMRIKGPNIPGVRPCCSDDNGRTVDLRILPSHYKITTRILDLYINHFKLFTPEELLRCSYATTVEQNIADWRGALLTAVSFFLDRVKGNLAFTGGEVIPTDSSGLGHPGAMTWEAVEARTSVTIGRQSEEIIDSQMTFNYHMLAIGFEKINEKTGEPKTELLLQYPGDYARIAYLVALAQDNPYRFSRLVLEPLLRFYKENLQIDTTILTKALDYYSRDQTNFSLTISKTAQLLQKGFFEGRTLQESEKLLIKHQALVDEITLDVISRGLSGSSPLDASGLSLTRRKRQKPQIEPRRAPRPQRKPQREPQKEPQKEPQREPRPQKEPQPVPVGLRFTSPHISSSSPAKKPIGPLKYDINSVLKAIDFQREAKEVAQILEYALEREPEREAIEVELKLAKLKRKFLRSIVDIENIGRGFVVDHKEGHYILLANTHLAKSISYSNAWLNTSALSPKIIGKAFLVLRHQDDEPEIGDIAIFVIEEKEAWGGLVPIKMKSEFKDGEIATLVRRFRRSVSSGYLFRAGDAVVLLGAKSWYGDSGSPYLVKTENGYSAVAVHRGDGPTGMLITPGVNENMLRALAGRESSNFRVVTKDNRKINAVIKFLEGLQTSSPLLSNPIGSSSPLDSGKEGIETIVKFIRNSNTDGVRKLLQKDRTLATETNLGRVLGMLEYDYGDMGEFVRNSALKTIPSFIHANESLATESNFKPVLKILNDKDAWSEFWYVIESALLAIPSFISANKSLANQPNLEIVLNMLIDKIDVFLAPLRESSAKLTASIIGYPTTQTISPVSIRYLVPQTINYFIQAEPSLVHSIPLYLLPIILRLDEYVDRLIKIYLDNKNKALRIGDISAIKLTSILRLSEMIRKREPSWNELLTNPDLEKEVRENILEHIITPIKEKVSFSQRNSLPALGGKLTFNLDTTVDVKNLDNFLTDTNAWWIINLYPQLLNLTAVSSDFIPLPTLKLPVFSHYFTRTLFIYSFSKLLKGIIPFSFEDRFAIEGRLPDEVKYISLSQIITAIRKFDWSQKSPDTHIGLIVPVIYDGAVKPPRTDFLEGIFLTEDIVFIKTTTPDLQISQITEESLWEHNLNQARAKQLLALCLRASRKSEKTPQEEKLSLIWQEFKSQMDNILSSGSKRIRNKLIKPLWIKSSMLRRYGFRLGKWKKIQPALSELENIRQENPLIIQSVNSLLRNTIERIEGVLGQTYSSSPLVTVLNSFRDSSNLDGSSSPVEWPMVGGIDIDSLPIVTNGLLHPIQAAYCIAHRHRINPFGLDLRGIYGASGPDLTTALLTFDPKEVICIDMEGINIDELKYAKEEWSEYGDRIDPWEPSLRLSYNIGRVLRRKQNDYFWRLAYILRYFDRLLILELKLLGADKDKIDIYKNDRGNIAVEFPWAYPGEAPKKRKFIFITADITAPLIYPTQLKDVLQSKNIDFFYLKSASNTMVYAERFIEVIARSIKKYMLVSPLANVRESIILQVDIERLLTEINYSAFHLIPDINTAYKEYFHTSLYSKEDYGMYLELWEKETSEEEQSCPGEIGDGSILGGSSSPVGGVTFSSFRASSPVRARRSFLLLNPNSVYYSQEPSLISRKGKLLKGTNRIKSVVTRYPDTVRSVIAVKDKSINLYIHKELLNRWGVSEEGFLSMLSQTLALDEQVDFSTLTPSIFITLLDYSSAHFESSYAKLPDNLFIGINKAFFSTIDNSLIQKMIIQVGLFHSMLLKDFDKKNGFQILIKLALKESLNPWQMVNYIIGQRLVKEDEFIVSMWNAFKSILREYYFRIDKQERDSLDPSGIMTDYLSKGLMGSGFGYLLEKNFINPRELLELLSNEETLIRVANHLPIGEIEREIDRSHWGLTYEEIKVLISFVLKGTIDAEHLTHIIHLSHLMFYGGLTYAPEEKRKAIELLFEVIKVTKKQAPAFLDLIYHTGFYRWLREGTSVVEEIKLEDGRTKTIVAPEFLERMLKFSKSYDKSLVIRFIFTVSQPSEAMIKELGLNKLGINKSLIQIISHIFSLLNLGGLSIGSQQLVKVLTYEKLMQGQKVENIEPYLSQKIIPALRFLDYYHKERNLASLGAELNRLVDKEDKEGAEALANFLNYLAIVATSHNVGGSGFVERKAPDQLYIRPLPSYYITFKLLIDALVRTRILSIKYRYPYHTSISGHLGKESLLLMFASFFLDVPDALELVETAPAQSGELGYPGIYMYEGVTVDIFTGEEIYEPEKFSGQTNIYDRSKSVAIRYEDEKGILGTIIEYPYLNDLRRKGLFASAISAYLVSEDKRDPLRNLLAQVYADFTQALKMLYESFGFSQDEIHHLMAETYQGPYLAIKKGVNSDYLIKAVEILRSKLDAEKLTQLSSLMDSYQEKIAQIIYPKPSILELMKLAYEGKLEEVSEALKQIMRDYLYDNFNPQTYSISVKRITEDTDIPPETIREIVGQLEGVSREIGDGSILGGSSSPVAVSFEAKAKRLLLDLSREIGDERIKYLPPDVIVDLSDYIYLTEHIIDPSDRLASSDGWERYMENNPEIDVEEVKRKQEETNYHQIQLEVKRLKAKIKGRIKKQEGQDKFLDRFAKVYALFYYENYFVKSRVIFFDDVTGKITFSPDKPTLYVGPGILCFDIIGSWKEDKGYRLLLIDIDPFIVKTTQHYLEFTDKRGIKIIEQDASKIAFPENTFAFIQADGVLHEMEQEARVEFIQRAFLQLAMGGKLIIRDTAREKMKSNPATQIEHLAAEVERQGFLIKEPTMRHWDGLYLNFSLIAEKPTLANAKRRAAKTRLSSSPVRKRKENLGRFYFDFFNVFKMFGIAGKQSRFILVGSSSNKGINYTGVVGSSETGSDSDNRGSDIKNSEYPYKRDDFFFLFVRQGRVGQEFVFGYYRDARLNLFIFYFFNERGNGFISTQMVNNDIGIKEISHGLRDPFKESSFPFSAHPIFKDGSFGIISTQYPSAFPDSANGGRELSFLTREVRSYQPLYILYLFLKGFQQINGSTIHSGPPSNSATIKYTPSLAEKQEFYPTRAKREIINDSSSPVEIVYSLFSLMQSISGAGYDEQIFVQLFKREGTEGVYEDVMDLIYGFGSNAQENNSLVTTGGIKGKVREITVAGNQNRLMLSGKNNYFPISGFGPTQLLQSNTSITCFTQNVLGLPPDTMVKEEGHRLTLEGMLELFREMDLFFGKELIGKGNTGKHIFPLDIRIKPLGADVLNGIPGSEQLQNHGDSDSRPLNPWFAVKNPWIDGNPFEQQRVNLHRYSLPIKNSISFSRISQGKSGVPFFHSSSPVLSVSQLAGLPVNWFNRQTGKPANRITNKSSSPVVGITRMPRVFVEGDDYRFSASLRRLSSSFCSLELMRPRRLSMRNLEIVTSLLILNTESFFNPVLGKSGWPEVMGNSLFPRGLEATEEMNAMIISSFWGSAETITAGRTLELVRSVNGKGTSTISPRLRAIVVLDFFAVGKRVDIFLGVVQELEALRGFCQFSQERSRQVIFGNGNSQQYPLMLRQTQMVNGFKCPVFINGGKQLSHSSSPLLKYTISLPESQGKSPIFKIGDRDSSILNDPVGSSSPVLLVSQLASSSVSRYDVLAFSGQTGKQANRITNNSSSPVAFLLSNSGFFLEFLRNPGLDELRKRSVFTQNQLSQRIVLSGLEGDEEMFWLGELNPGGFKRFPVIGDRMGIPESSFFFNSFEGGNLLYFICLLHNILPPKFSIFPSFRYDHISGSNNLYPAFTQSLNNSGQISPALGLTEDKIPVLFTLSDKGIKETGLFYFFGIDSVFSNMSYIIFIPKEVLNPYHRLNIPDLLNNVKGFLSFSLTSVSYDSSSPVGLWSKNGYIFDAFKVPIIGGDGFNFVVPHNGEVKRIIGKQAVPFSEHLGRVQNMLIEWPYADIKLRDAVYSNMAFSKLFDYLRVGFGDFLARLDMGKHLVTQRAEVFRDSKYPADVSFNANNGLRSADTAFRQLQPEFYLLMFGKGQFGKRSDNPFFINTDYGFSHFSSPFLQPPQVYHRHSAFVKGISHSVSTLDRSSSPVQKRGQALFRILSLRDDGSSSPMEWPMVGGIDIDSLPIVTNGLLHPIQAAYCIAHKNIINPLSQGLIGINGASGSDLATVLLTFDPKQVFNIELRNISLEKLEEAREEWGEYGDKKDFWIDGERKIQRIISRAVQIRYNKYHWHAFDTDRYFERLLILELKSLVVEKEKIDFKKDTYGNLIVNFPWAYPGEKSRDRMFIFIRKNLFKPSNYLPVIRKILNTNNKEIVDFYYQKSAMEWAGGRDRYIPQIASATQRFILINPIAEEEEPGRFVTVDIESTLKEVKGVNFHLDTDINEAFKEYFPQDIASKYGWYVELWIKEETDSSSPLMSKVRNFVNFMLSIILLFSSVNLYAQEPAEVYYSQESEITLSFGESYLKLYREAQEKQRGLWR